MIATKTDRPTCHACGSDAVGVNTTAEWCPATRSLRIDDIGSHGTCYDCEGHVSIQWEAVPALRVVQQAQSMEQLRHVQGISESMRRALYHSFREYKVRNGVKFSDLRNITRE